MLYMTLKKLRAAEAAWAARVLTWAVASSGDSRAVTTRGVGGVEEGAVMLRHNRPPAASEIDLTAAVAALQQQLAAESARLDWVEAVLVGAIKRQTFHSFIPVTLQLYQEGIFMLALLEIEPRQTLREAIDAAIKAGKESQRKGRGWSTNAKAVRRACCPAGGGCSATSPALSLVSESRRGRYRPAELAAHLGRWPEGHHAGGGRG